MIETERKIVKKRPKQEKPSKIKKLEMIAAELENLAGAGFTGYVKINYSQGAVGRVEKFEEILKQPK